MDRIDPRGPPPSSSALALSWVPPPNSHRSPNRVSPRRVKLQSVPVPPPPYALSSLRDQINGQFRHELFQFHQILLDVVNRVRQTQQYPTKTPESSDQAMLELLTSDHSTAILKEFFMQWQRVQQSNASISIEEQDLLFQVLDTIFRNLPMVLTEQDLRDGKRLMRYLAALRSLRELLLAMLYKHPPPPSSSSGASNQTQSPFFASTAALLSLASGSTTASTATTPLNPPTPKEKPRVPLYLYCQQLEHELEALRHRQRHLGMMQPPGADRDIGLLNGHTVTLLLQYWELPKSERLGFLSQVASQTAQGDCETVLDTMMSKASVDAMLILWDALERSPYVQRALLARKPATLADGDDASGSPERSFTSRGRSREGAHGAIHEDEEDDDMPPLKGPGGARDTRRSTRFVDMRGFTDVFDEHDEDESDEEDGGDAFHGRGKARKRRHRVRIRERGRTPPAQRKSTIRMEPIEPVRAEPKVPTTTTQATTELPMVERLYKLLIDFLSQDKIEAHHTVVDAAWQLVEAMDATQRREKVPLQRKATSLRMPSRAPSQSQIASGPTEPPSAAGNSSRLNLPRLTMHEALGTNLTSDQQYLMKVDQLQSLLTSLGAFSLHTMSTETITSAYRRMTALQKLFTSFSTKALEAVGLEPNVNSRTTGAKAPSSPPTTPHKRRPQLIDHSAPPDEQLVGSVEIILSKLGKMMRSLAPLTELRDKADQDEGFQSATAELLRLADVMEEGEESDEGHDSGPLQPRRRGLSLSPTKRLAVLNRLKLLAQSTQLDNLTGLISTTCDELVTLKTLNEQQQQQHDELSQSSGGSIARARRKTAITDDAESDSGANDLIKFAKKAKIRRASAAAQAKGGAAPGNVTPDMLDRGNDPDEEDDDEDDSPNPLTAPRFANRDIPNTIKMAANQRGSKLFNVGILHRIVYQMYREHYETMLASLQYGSRRMEFSEFMYDWHIRKYGLKTLAQQHLLKLIQSLRKYERKVYHCQLCLRFLGTQSPLGYHEHKFVLGLLDKWSSGSFSGPSRHRIEHTPRHFKIRITFAISTIQEALFERFGVYFRSMDIVIARIKAHALRQDEDFIKETDVLAIAIDEWLNQRQRLELILEAVYAAGDLNGDGSLEYEEFTAVLFHLAPSLDDKFAQKVFTAAHDYLKPRRISFPRFMDVVLLERVLSASTSLKATKPTASERAAANNNGASGAAGASGTTARGSDEDEESYQFNLLQETWEHDREVVAQVLQAITHQQTAASIQFRVTFLTQIISKRVDSKTAWMCHRQIMREISRYQNLNEEQIVVLKKKEETFKKAVMAIRRMQKLSSAFASAAKFPEQEATSESTGEIALQSDESDPGDGQEAPSPLMQKQHSYLSAVEDVLSSPDQATSSLDQIEALEDQLRMKFLEQADEAAIEDYKVALQKIRRMSVQVMSQEAHLEQFRAFQAEQERLAQAGHSIDGAMMDEDDEEEEEEEEEDGDGEEEEDLEEENEQ